MTPRRPSLPRRYNAKSHPDYAPNTCGDKMEAAMRETKNILYN